MTLPSSRNQRGGPDLDDTPFADPDGLEDLDTEAVEDLDAHEDASEVVGGYQTTGMTS